ncbi:MAG: hypothetical protein LBU32_16650 [Clostridiales bacterium]|jgi:hypothetical protein|nr:hypothetical protein [Clostridiales bacterium]
MNKIVAIVAVAAAILAFAFYARLSKPGVGEASGLVQIEMKARAYTLGMNSPSSEIQPFSFKPSVLYDMNGLILKGEDDSSIEGVEHINEFTCHNPWGVHVIARMNLAGIEIAEGPQGSFEIEKSAFRLYRISDDYIIFSRALMPERQYADLKKLSKDGFSRDLTGNRKFFKMEWIEAGSPASQSLSFTMHAEILVPEESAGVKMVSGKGAKGSNAFLKNNPGALREEQPPNCVYIYLPPKSSSTFRFRFAPKANIESSFDALLINSQITIDATEAEKNASENLPEPKVQVDAIYPTREMFKKAFGDEQDERLVADAFNLSWHFEKDAD